MRVAVLAVVLILTACGGSGAPQARSSYPPSATPTAAAGSEVTWAAPVHIDDPASVAGINLVGVSCPSNGLCVAIDNNGNAVTSSDPTGGAAAWNVTNVDGSVGPDSNGPRLTAVSCPSSGLCVAVGERAGAGGNVVTSSDPTGGVAAWTVTQVQGLPPFVPSGNVLSSISCSSNTFCVAGDYLGNLLMSTNPAGGATAWKVTHKGGAQCTLSETGALCAVTAVSCVSALCVATDYQGNMVTSANPGAGVAAWRATHLNTSTYLTSVSCTSTTLCVGVDNSGKVFSSSNPNGGAAAWKAASVDSTVALHGVFCPSSDLCVAVDGGGNGVTSTTPTGGAAAWKVTLVDGTSRLSGVSCPSSDKCIALDGGNKVVTSTNPAGGAAAWTITTLAGDLYLGDISCSTSSLCVATGFVGDATKRVIVTSTNPTGGPAAWTVTELGRSDGLEAVPSGVSCPSSGLCVAVGESVDGSSTIVTSTNPTGGASAWNVTAFTGEFVLLDVSCPTTSLCVAVDNGGDALISTNPTGGAATWKLTHIDNTPNNNNYLPGVSCPSISLCVAVSGAGNAVTSTNPTGGATAWKVTNVGGNKSLTQVSCSVSGFCVALDDYGNVVTSSNPHGGTAAWTATSVDRVGAGFSGISCPTSNLCVAVDNSGNVVTGIRQP